MKKLTLLVACMAFFMQVAFLQDINLNQVPRDKVLVEIGTGFW